MVILQSIIHFLECFVKFFTELSEILYETESFAAVLSPKTETV